MGAFLMGCTPVSKDYYEINYLNNYENGGYFKNSVVSKDGLIKRPQIQKEKDIFFKVGQQAKMNLLNLRNLMNNQQKT